MPTSFSHIALCLVTLPLPLLQLLQNYYCYFCHCYHYFHITLNTLPSKTVAIPYTCGLSVPLLLYILGRRPLPLWGRQSFPRILLFLILLLFSLMGGGGVGVFGHGLRMISDAQATPPFRSPVLLGRDHIQFLG